MGEMNEVSVPGPGSSGIVQGVAFFVIPSGFSIAVLTNMATASNSTSDFPTLRS
jgi:hypothetical protein